MFFLFGCGDLMKRTLVILISFLSILVGQVNAGFISRIKETEEKEHAKELREKEVKIEQQQLEDEQRKTNLEQNVREQNSADELNSFVHKKYQEYVAKIEDINIERETLGMKPKEILQYDNWTSPKGSENESVASARDLKSIIEVRVRYSDYVISYEKINLKRNRAKLKSKKIQSYTEWKEANSVVVPGKDDEASRLEENSRTNEEQLSPPLP
jgi:transketolase